MVNMPMRAFIALNIPAEIKTVLREESGRLRDLIQGGSVRWVRSEGIHLTLKFLGEISNDQLGDIHQALERVAERHPFFTLCVRDFGCFPNIRRPRVLWIGIADESGVLSQLQGAVEGQLVPLGFGKERRPFHPHLTLGRVRRNISLADLTELHEVLESYRVGSIGQFDVRELHLIKSVLSPSGAEYSTLGSYLLGGKRES